MYRKGGGKTVGVKLNENDLAILNHRLRQDGFDTFSEFVHAYIDRRYPKYEKNEQSEKLLERRDRGIKDPVTGDFSVDFYKHVDEEDLLKDFCKKYIYKKYTRDLVAYPSRNMDIFFTKPHLIQPLSEHVRTWIYDPMRRFAKYYDRKYQNPEVRQLIDEIRSL